MLTANFYVDVWRKTGPVVKSGNHWGLMSYHYGNKDTLVVGSNPAGSI